MSGRVRALLLAAALAGCEVETAPPGTEDGDAVVAIDRWPGRVIAPEAVPVGKPARVDAVPGDARALRVSGEGGVFADVDLGTTLAPRADGALEGDAGRVRVTLREDGFEDERVIAAPPRGPLARYPFTPSEATTLRLVDGVLELLDPGGAPRLRVARPLVLDRRGAPVSAALAIEGCAYDADPRPPWRRRRTPPGASRCALVVNSVEPVAPDRYPLLLDPLWSSAGTLSVPRVVAGVLLPGGLALFPGGFDLTGAVDVVELFDDTTSTFSVGAPLPAPRRSAALQWVEAGGHALLAGGCAGAPDCSATASALAYEPADGSWRPVGSLALPRLAAASFVDGTGGVIVAGGLRDASDTGSVTSAAERYDPASESFSAVAPLSSARGGMGVARLADGGAVLAGGFSGPSTQLRVVERYTPNGSWQSLPDLPSARVEPRVVQAPDGRVVVLGGSDLVTPLRSAVVLEESGWASTEPMLGAHARFNALILPSGWLIAVGGCCENVAEVARLAGPAVATGWHAVASPPESRERAAQVLLPSGRLLLAGGLRGGSVEPSADAVLLSPEPQGTPCDTGGACATGACVDGVCCDSACDAPCRTCAARLGAPADGICGVASAGLPDPHDRCAAQADGCGRTGSCGADGACELEAAGEGCACPGGGAGSCDGAGTCVCAGSICEDDATERSAGGERIACAPFRCVAGACAIACDSSTQCQPGFVCDRARTCVAAAALPAPVEACVCGAGPGATRPKRDFALLALLALLGLTRSAGRARRRSARRRSSR